MEENPSFIAKDMQLLGFNMDLKPEQVESLISAIEGQDLMAVLPTGFGSAAPSAIGLKRGNSVGKIDWCTLVITSLKA